MAKKKYYAVAVGRSSGIFTDWPTAEKQVKGFAAAKFKSFPTRAEAEAWLEDPVYQKKERADSSRQETKHAPLHKQMWPRMQLLSIPMGAALIIPAQVVMGLSLKCRGNAGNSVADFGIPPITVWK